MTAPPPRVLPLSDLLARLGPALVEPYAAGTDPLIDDVSLAEPGLGSCGVPGDLLLAVGCADVAQARQVLAAARAAGVAAVAVRRALLTPELRAAAKALPVVAVADDANWAHLAWLARELLDRASAPGLPAAAATAPDELFTLADACAALLGAPVTIEDTRSRVLAYSERHDLTDPIRVSTIVGRRVPAEVVASLRARGVFRHLLRSDEPLFLPASADGSLSARLVIPVRAGGAWLGSLWAMVEAPVAPALAGPLREVAALVAVHLLRLSSEADAVRRLAAEQLRAALSGEAAAAGAALPDPPWRVVVLATPPGTAGESAVTQWAALARRASWPRPRLVAIDEDVVGVLGAGDRGGAGGLGGSGGAGGATSAGGAGGATSASGAGDAGDRGPAALPGTWTWLRRMLAALAEDHPWVWAAAGPVVDAAPALPGALHEAHELARLCAAGRVPGPSVTTDQAWAPLVVARAVGAAVPAAAVGTLADGRRLDPTQAATLGAWLDHPGDARACAAALHVHPNTVRYRLARLREDLAVDLDDPTVRLALALQVRAGGAEPPVRRGEPAAHRG